jgi:hypothetical protein
MFGRRPPLRALGQSSHARFLNWAPDAAQHFYRSSGGGGFGGLDFGGIPISRTPGISTILGKTPTSGIQACKISPYDPNKLVLGSTNDCVWVDFQYEAPDSPGATPKNTLVPGQYTFTGFNASPIPVPGNANAVFGWIAGSWLCLQIASAVAYIATPTQDISSASPPLTLTSLKNQFVFQVSGFGVIPGPNNATLVNAMPNKVIHNVPVILLPCGVDTSDPPLPTFLIIAQACQPQS